MEKMIVQSPELEYREEIELKFINKEKRLIRYNKLDDRNKNEEKNHSKYFDMIMQLKVHIINCIRHF